MATVVLARPLVGQAESAALNIIDTDAHERAELQALLPYLAPMWRKYITDFGWQPERLLLCKIFYQNAQALHQKMPALQPR